MLRALVVSTGLAVLAGCTPEAAPVRPVPSVTVASTDHAVAAESSSAIAADCQLETKSWGDFHEPGKLRFSMADPPYVVFSNGAVRVSLGSRLGVATEVLYRGIRLEGVGRPEEVSLFQARMLVFADVAAPRAETPVFWTGTSRDSLLSIVHRLPTWGSEHLALRRPTRCADLSLNAVELDVADELRGSAERERAYFVDPAVAIRATPSSAPIVTLPVDEDDEVAILERSSARVRVVWVRKLEVIRAWVDQASLSAEAPSGSGLGEDFGHGGLGLYGVGGATYWTCPNELVLFAKRGDQIHRVGSVAPNTEVSMGVVQGGFRDVSIDHTHSALQPAADVTFLVWNDALKECNS